DRPSSSRRGALSATLSLLSPTPPPPAYISPLPLHDALPIFARRSASGRWPRSSARRASRGTIHLREARLSCLPPQGAHARGGPRSEEHTSELQSLTNIVCRLLLEKNKPRRLTIIRLIHRPFP